MKRALWLANCAMGVAVVLLGPAVQNARARGGREGFSRESPAASGGFSSHSGSAQERKGSVPSSQRQTPASMQASHQRYASRAQASREQTATGMQSSAQQFHRSYPYGAAPYPVWDAGAGLAAATTGAAMGAAAASSKALPPGQVYVASPPCGSPIVIPVGSMKYFNADLPGTPKDTGRTDVLLSSWRLRQDSERRL